MSIKILSETQTRLVFDEASTNLDEILTVARRKWPEALMDFIGIYPPFNDNGFALVISYGPQEEFRPDGQLTINPSITLAQLIRATAAKPGEAYRDKVTLCWNDHALHLKRHV